MEKSSKPNELLAPVIVLVCICLVASFLLAGTYQITKPIIDMRAAEAASQARIAVLPEAAGSTFSPVEDATLVKGVKEVYKADNGAGYAMTTTYNGFGGQVEMMVGVSASGQITGLSVLNQSETPGIGSNALTDDFFQRFLGISSINGPLGSGGQDVDMYGGATYTSTAVFGDVEAALMQYGVINGAEYVAPVELTEEELIDQACSEVLPDGDVFGIINCELSEGVLAVYAPSNGTGYVVYAKGTGFAGPTAPIQACVGLDVNGTVTGVKVISHGETNGIGSLAIDDADYLAGYIGQKGEASLDAYSGATYTSDGLRSIVNRALTQFTEIQ